MDVSNRKKNTIRVLLSEGSSLSAREALSALGLAGYCIDVCDPNPLCLGRFSRFVHRFYQCPPSGRNPQGYLTFLLDLLKQEHYDVLLPVQEQAFLFAKVREQLSKKVGLAVTDFAAFEQLQSKVGFLKVLQLLELPYPTTRLIRERRELEAAQNFPYYVKSAYGTASSGVWRVNKVEERDQLIMQLERKGYLDGSQELLVQEVVAGTLGMVQAVFDHGRLIALHCWQRLVEGARGSSSMKQGVYHPLVQQHVAKLGQYLNWHGSLAIDYLFDPADGKPFYIDANPRLVECMNATFSGLNLAEIMVRLSRGEEMMFQDIRRSGVRSSMLMMALLRLAEQGESRRMVLREIWHGLLRSGIYAGSREELTPWKSDLLSYLPLGVVMVQLLLNPARGKQITAGAVADYALTQNAIRVIQQEM